MVRLTAQGFGAKCGLVSNSAKASHRPDMRSILGLGPWVKKKSKDGRNHVHAPTDPFSYALLLLLGFIIFPDVGC